MLATAQPSVAPCRGGVRPHRRAAARACHGGAAPQPDAPAVPRRAVLSGLAGAALLPGVGRATAALSPSEERAAAFLRFVAAQDARPSALAVPDFPAAATWFNAPPLSLGRELRGRVLVLDFFTLCCVNCMHVLPELAATEAKYAAAPVTVVGVHSPKFAAEGDDAAIRAAVLRYGVTHPVLNDARKSMWDALRVDAWPTLAVVAPTGRLITTLSGEGHQRDLEDLIEASLSYYSAKGLLSQAAVVVPDGLEPKRRDHWPPVPRKPRTAADSAFGCTPMSWAAYLPHPARASAIMKALASKSESGPQ
jgi:thiol-disulfide isomerase/thioredoxin